MQARSDVIINSQDQHSYIKYEEHCKYKPRKINLIYEINPKCSIWRMKQCFKTDKRPINSIYKTITRLFNCKMGDTNKKSNPNNIKNVPTTIYLPKKLYSDIDDGDFGNRQVTCPSKPKNISVAETYKRTKYLIHPYELPFYYQLDNINKKDSIE